MSEIERRVENLERQNRQLQFGLVAVVTMLLAVWLVGVLMPQDVIEARVIRVVDEFGVTRAEMDSLRIAYTDFDGTDRVVLSKFGVHYYDEQERTRAAMDILGLQAVDPESGVTWRAPQ